MAGSVLISVQWANSETGVVQPMGDLVSEARRASVYITRRAESVRWASDDRLIDVSFDVFIFYYDETAKLLFICASKRFLASAKEPRVA